jgi:uncharacterized protein YjiS (DUF1127 family)
VWASQPDELPAQESVSSAASVPEFELVSGLAQKSDEELRAYGFTDSGIQSVRNYRQTAVESIRQLESASDSILVDLGYSREQISLIRNFDGTDSSIKALSASVFLSTTIQSLRYDSRADRTTGEYTWAISWSGVPIFKDLDLVATGWNDYWILERWSNQVTYKGSCGYQYNAVSEPETIGGGRGVKFYMNIRGANWGGCDTYLSCASGSVKVSHAQRTDLHLRTAYGHTQYNISAPTATISGSGANVSINFNWGVNKEVEQYKSRSA